MQEIPLLSFYDKETMFNNKLNVFRHNEKTQTKVCQTTKQNEMVQILKGKCQVISTDTTADRPCCCHPKESNPVFIQNNRSKDRYVTHVVSRPLFLKQGILQDILLNENL